MKIMIILLTIFILSSGHLSAGRLDDLEKELDNKMDLIEKKFDEKSRKLDEQFANTLKDEWFNVKFKEGKPFFDKPKPVTIPQAPKPKTVKPDATPVIIPVLPPEPVDDKEPPKTPPVIGPTEEEYNIYFDFLGKPVTISLPKKVKTLRLNAVKKNEIASFWQEVSTSPHETTLTQLKAYYQDFLKSDWAFLMLLETMAKEVYPEDVNMQNLYVWFLLIKTGYQARVAYDNENIYLLLPSSTMVYGRTYFTFSGEKFYKLSTRGLDKKMGSVYTYKEDYPGANKKLELRIIQWPRIKKIEKTRELTFSHSGKEYSVPVLYQGEIITFVKNYPQTTIDSYAGAPLSDFSRKSLLTKLAELIKGMQETEAVNLLLAFVQKSFAYKTDQQQFGYEKWFFAEETLYYPFSDCEDRSVMFGRLVKDLLGIPVVMLHYPQHLATAVLFSKPVSGDKVKYNNKTYAVCDPTYTGASYGMAMPQFKGVSPEVTEF